MVRRSTFVTDVLVAGVRKAIRGVTKDGDSLICLSNADWDSLHGTKDPFSTLAAVVCYGVHYLQ